MQREIDIRELISILYEGRIIIILITLISGLAGGVVSYFFITPVYEARTDLLISQNFKESEVSNLSLGEIETNLKLIESYQYIVKSERVMQKTAELLGKGNNKKELAKKIKVETNGNSQILSIIVEDTEINKAADIANRVAEVFKSEIKAILKLDNIHILSPAFAEANAEPVRPKPLLNSIISTLVGLVLSLGIVFIRRFAGYKISSKQDVTGQLSLPVLGEVPFINAPHKNDNGFQYGERYYKLVSQLQKNSSIADFYRSIRTNLQFQNHTKGYQRILFTSSKPGEGKSLTTGNMSIVMAMDHKKTVYVDCDLRKPNGHHMFGIPNRNGVTSYLAGDAQMDTIIRKTDVPYLYLIPAGPIPPNPAELLSSDKMQIFLEELEQRFDYIFLDCPPMIVSDATILAMKADCCVFVVNAQKNSSTEAKQKINLLKEMNANLLGVVLNKSTTKVTGEYYY